MSIFIRGACLSSKYALVRDDRFISYMRDAQLMVPHATAGMSAALHTSRAVQDLMLGRETLGLLALASLLLPLFSEVPMAGERPSEVRRGNMHSSAPRLITIGASVLGAANGLTGGRIIAILSFNLFTALGTAGLTLSPLALFRKENSTSRFASEASFASTFLAMGVVGLYGLSSEVHLLMVACTAASAVLAAFYFVSKQGLSASVGDGEGPRHVFSALHIKRS